MLRIVLNQTLKNLLKDFAKPALDLRPSRAAGRLVEEIGSQAGFQAFQLPENAHA